MDKNLKNQLVKLIKEVLSEAPAPAIDPETGLSLTLTGAYDINEQTEIHRIDAVYGTDLIYGELALRMWGAAQ